MPIYNFACLNCSNEQLLEMSISELIKLKNSAIACSMCKDGILKQKISKIQSKVERDKDYIIQEAKEDAKKIVDKIRAGDEKTINEIYGDKPNPHKV